jgi:hypothetical protein
MSTPSVGEFARKEFRDTDTLQEEAQTRHTLKRAFSPSIKHL